MATGLSLIEPAEAFLLEPSAARTKARLASAMGDADILELVKEATGYFETQTERQLITATWRQTFDGVPEDGIFRLLRNPVQSICSVEILDEDDEWVEVVGARLDSDCEPARVYPPFEDEWPEPQDVPGNVRITFVAGYGDSAEDVPADVRRAVTALLSHYHEHPEAVVTGGDMRTFEVPLGVQNIIDAYTYTSPF